MKCALCATESWYVFAAETNNGNVHKICAKCLVREAGLLVMKAEVRLA